MIKNNLKHEVTALEKSRRKSVLKGYLITAITCSIVGVCMLPVLADSDAETAINNMSNIVFGIIRAVLSLLLPHKLPLTNNSYLHL